MTPTARRILLWILVLLGSYVGVRATFFPASSGVRAEAAAGAR